MLYQTAGDRRAQVRWTGGDSHNDQRCRRCHGRGKGIGQACVLALAEAGYPVVVADLYEAGAHVTSIAVAGGGRARFVQTDVTSIDDVRALMEFAATAFGRLQVLVNNAAVTRVIDLLDLIMDDWDEVLRVNARQLFRDAGGSAGGWRLPAAEAS